ncbi:MAG: CPBP family intramembrane metalloprotease [Fusobacterium necrophorum]|nr:CPBP family intramembrane metalloprotease [Fusobacterium necrophorum]
MKKQKGAYIVLVIATLSLFTILPAMLMTAGGKLIFEKNTFFMKLLISQSYILELIAFCIITLIIIGIYRIAFRREDICENKSLFSFKGAILMIITGLGVSGISYLWIKIAHLIPFLLKSLEEMNAANERMANGSALGIFLLAAIIAPLLEEVVFRGIVLRSIEKLRGTAAALISSSIIFGIFHGNLVQFVYTFIMGIIAGYVYIKTRNILFPVFIHFGNNAYASIPDLIHSESTLMLLDYFTVVMIFPTIFIIWKISKQTKTLLFTKE